MLVIYSILCFFDVEKNCMKSKLTLLFLSAGLCLAATNLKAQRLFFIFGHLQYNSPSGGNFRDAYKFGLGAEAGAGLGWGRTFLTGTIGYDRYKVEDAYKAKRPEARDLSLTPVKLGIRQYILAKKIYLKADGGVAFANNNDQKKSCATWDAGVGLKLGILDLGVDYGATNFALSGFTNTSQNIPAFQFKAGLAFGL